jgi:hypothetical protein
LRLIVLGDRPCLTLAAFIEVHRRLMHPAADWSVEQLGDALDPSQSGLSQVEQ